MNFINAAIIDFKTYILRRANKLKIKFLLKIKNISKNIK